MSEPDTNDLTSFLASRDVPCPNCAYNLRGLTGGRCPECHEQLSLQVSITDPRVGAIMAAAAGLLAGAGAAAILLCFIAYFSLKERHSHWSSREVVAVIIIPSLVTLVEGLLTFGLVSAKGRAWFRRLDSNGRGVVVVGSWAITALAVVVFAHFIR